MIKIIFFDIDGTLRPFETGRVPASTQAALRRAHEAGILCAIATGRHWMVARGLVGFVFVPWLGYIASCFASPLAWIFADAFLIPCFYHCLKKLKKQYSTSA